MDAPDANACAIDCCLRPPITVLSYATDPPHTYALCATHREFAIAWVCKRFGPGMAITEEESPLRQEALFELPE